MVAFRHFDYSKHRLEFHLFADDDDDGWNGPFSSTIDSSENVPLIFRLQTCSRTGPFAFRSRLSWFFFSKRYLTFLNSAPVSMTLLRTMMTTNGSLSHPKEARDAYHVVCFNAYPSISGLVVHTSTLEPAEVAYTHRPWWGMGGGVFEGVVSFFAFIADAELLHTSGRYWSRMSNLFCPGWDAGSVGKGSWGRRMKFCMGIAFPDLKGNTFDVSSSS